MTHLNLTNEVKSSLASAECSFCISSAAALSKVAQMAPLDQEAEEQSSLNPMSAWQMERVEGIEDFVTKRNNPHTTYFFKESEDTTVALLKTQGQTIHN